MIRILRHPLLLSVLTGLGLYLVFAYGLQPPLPKSLLFQYMVFCVIGILMVATFDDATAQRMAAPLALTFGHPRLWPLRILLGVLLVAAAVWLTYQAVKPDLDAPVELRTVHPAPPGKIRVYDKSYDLLKLENPLRNLETSDPEAFEAQRQEGGELYYKNCIYCHGDLLDGRGPFAQGFNPRPANFQDVGTIAQLQESYLFWRITTGGPGLPREAAPWASAMPVWHEMLSEEEVWKIILFLYDYTGHVPRSWELEGEGAQDAAAAAQEEAEPGAGALDEEAIEALYQRRCAHCHGEEGDGLGPAAEFMYPLPRDFTLGVFKYKTTHADEEFPTDEDLRRTIRDGLPGTAMPAWSSILSPAVIDGLIQLIKVFGGWEEEEPEYRPIDEGTPVASSEESLARGRKLFEKACVQCHGEAGRGNITSGKKLKDDWQNRVWPRNLTRPQTWRWTETARDVFQRVSTGIRGTPMPEHTTVMPEADRWDIANYVMTLRETAVPFDPAQTVVRGQRIEGALPEGPDDPAWDQATPATFPLIPNIIKDPRLYFSLNDRVSVRVLFNTEEIALRLDVDDRSYSLPGDPLELRYRIEEVAPTRDALAVQFPVSLSETSEKPWFRHGDPKHGVNIWQWRAPSVDPAAEAEVRLYDAQGPERPPVPRAADGDLKGLGVWRDGQWRIVLRRALVTEVPQDIQFAPGRYVPVAFANWDGLMGEAGSRHSFTSWYWLLLTPEAQPLLLYGAPTGSGAATALFLFLAVRRQRRRFDANPERAGGAPLI